MTDLYEKIAEQIIEEQEHIIGPLAFDQARKVSGITVNIDQHSVQLSGDKKDLVEKLVRQYEYLFGGTSIEVCKDAVRKLNVPKDQLPTLLQ